MNNQGTSSGEAAAIFNIPSSGLIRKWRRQFASQGTDALISKKEGRLNMMKKTKKSTTWVFCPTPRKGGIRINRVFFRWSDRVTVID